jgi:ABC-type metal ion transport system substrate-binding protein
MIRIRNIYKYVVRKALENKKHWVVEVYIDNKIYPNIISGRYTSKKKALKDIAIYQADNNKKFIFWGEI